jgi:peptidoglycan/xylan/chitin deacetylase (PgdA/CDA1 family)
MPSFDGDVVLLHGNGNEKEGIEKVIPYVESEGSVWLGLDRIV